MWKAPRERGGKLMTKFDNIPYWFGVVLVFVMLFLALGGCSDPLSDASFEVRQEFHRSITSFGLVAQDFAVKADLMVAKKHKIQRRLQAVEFAQAYDLAKDANGNLVLTPEEFTELTAAILEGQHAIVTSQAQWQKVSGGFRDTLQLLRTVNVTTMTTTEAIHATKKSVQALTNRVLQALGSLVAAAGFAL